MNENGEMFVDFCAEHSHWWKVVSYKNYTGFTEPCCGELNRPHLFWKKIKKIITRCKSEARGRCSTRSSYSDSKTTAQAKEMYDG